MHLCHKIRREDQKNIVKFVEQYIHKLSPKWMNKVKYEVTRQVTSDSQGKKKIQQRNMPMNHFILNFVSADFKRVGFKNT